MGTSDDATARRLRLAFDLYAAAEEIQRQNLRRRNPEASEEEIEEGIRRWLAKPPELPPEHFRRRRLDR
jgi:hypothetical protein